jgi:hypothetical protein
LARGERELLDHGAVRREKFAVFGIGRALAHAASVSHRATLAEPVYKYAIIRIY